jgi:hypothetical protein
MDSDRRVIGCHVTQGARVHKAFDDVASTIHESLCHGVAGDVDGVDGDYAEGRGPK